jgi:hypothetical protein
MFCDAKTFNQSIGNWNVSSVEMMENMFDAAIVFNQHIGSWNVSRVTDMEGFFKRVHVFKSRYWMLGCIQRKKHAVHV